jgi:hypothetical protein
MSNIQHGRANEGKAFSVLATCKSFAMFLDSTSGDSAKLGGFDESFHEGILLTMLDSKLA